jgi:F420-0:gamma-glutamyl ligase
MVAAGGEADGDVIVVAQKAVSKVEGPGGSD